MASLVRSLRSFNRPAHAELVRDAGGRDLSPDSCLLAPFAFPPCTLPPQITRPPFGSLLRDQSRILQQPAGPDMRRHRLSD
jgi:hypothetical protein